MQTKQKFKLLEAARGRAQESPRYVALGTDCSPGSDVVNVAGADPGFFLGGGALVSCSTSTPINHIVFFWQNSSCIRKP